MSFDPTDAIGAIVAGMLPIDGGVAPASSHLTIPLVFSIDVSGDEVIGFQNPTDKEALVAAIVRISGTATSATFDVGVDDAGDASNDTLIDGASGGAAGVYSSFANAGTNGAAFRAINARGGGIDWIVYKASASGVSGQLVIILIPRE